MPEENGEPRSFTPEQTRNTLEEALHEIQVLRRHNEVLCAKVDTMMLMATMAKLQWPNQGGIVSGSDVCSRLQAQIDLLNK